MLCKDLATLHRLNTHAATTDILENPVLPDAFSVRTEILRTTQSLVMRNRAIWDKIMNVAVATTDNPAAIKEWDGKGKSAKSAFERAGKKAPDLLPPWLTNGIVGGAIELFDNMFRTPEIHHSGTLRKWALAQSLQVKTIDLIQGFVHLTELTLFDLQNAMGGTHTLASRRDTYFSHCVALVRLTESHDDYSKNRGKFKAIAEQLANSPQDQSTLVMMDRPLANTDITAWRAYREVITATLASDPTNITLRQMRLRFLDLRWEELTHLELIEVVRDSRDNGRARQKTDRIEHQKLLSDQLENIHTMDAAHLYDFALDLKEKGGLIDALNCYQVLYSRYPQKHKALVGQAFCLAELNRVPEATRQIDDLLQKWPGEMNGLYLKGVIAHKEGNLDESIALISDVLERDPNWAVAWGQAGLVELDRKNYQDAITYLSRAIDIAPTFKNGIFNRGYAYMQKGDAALAVADFRTVLTLSPYDPDAALYLGNLLVADDPTAHRDDIVRSYVIAHRGNPDNDTIFAPLMATLERMAAAPQAPHFEFTFISNRGIAKNITMVNLLSDHRYYREALQLWCDVADQVDEFGAPHVRLHHEVTLLYWLARNDFRGSAATPTLVPLDRCDDAESIFKALLSEIHAIGKLPKSFDVQLVANIWMQLSQIEYSRAEQTDSTEAKAGFLDRALKYAKNAHKISPSPTRLGAIHTLLALKE